MQVPNNMQLFGMNSHSLLFVVQQMLHAVVFSRSAFSAGLYLKKIVLSLGTNLHTAAYLQLQILVIAPQEGRDNRDPGGWMDVYLPVQVVHALPSGFHGSLPLFPISLVRPRPALHYRIPALRAAPRTVRATRRTHPPRPMRTHSGGRARRSLAKNPRTACPPVPPPASVQRVGRRERLG